MAESSSNEHNNTKRHEGKSAVTRKQRRIWKKSYLHFISKLCPQQPVQVLYESFESPCTHTLQTTGYTYRSSAYFMRRICYTIFHINTCKKNFNITLLHMHPLVLNVLGALRWTLPLVPTLRMRDVIPTLPHKFALSFAYLSTMYQLKFLKHIYFKFYCPSKKHALLEGG
jgi:hypothetical protein